MILLDAQTIFTQALGFSSRISLAHLSIAIVLCVVTSIGLALSSIARHRMLLAQAGVGITALAGWLMIGLDGPPFSADILIALALAGIGLGMTLPNLPSISSHRVSAGSQGLANAVNQSSRHLGSAIAAAVSQQVGDPVQSLGLILTSCCVASALLLLLSLRGGEDGQARAAGPTQAPEIA